MGYGIYPGGINWLEECIIGAWQWSGSELQNHDIQQLQWSTLRHQAHWTLPDMLSTPTYHFTQISHHLPLQLHHQPTQHHTSPLRPCPPRLSRPLLLSLAPNPSLHLPTRKPPQIPTTNRITTLPKPLLAPKPEFLIFLLSLIRLCPVSPRRRLRLFF